MEWREGMRDVLGADGIHLFLCNRSQQHNGREYMFAVQPRDYARLSSSRNIHHSQMFTNTRGLA